MDETTDAILSFLGEEPQSATQGGSDALQVLLFMKVDGATSDYEAILRDMTRSRGATRFASSDNGFIASFRSAQMALGTAIDVQTAFTAQRDPVQVHIGIDAVDQTAADAISLSAAGRRAARLGASATAGEILVADVVRQLVTGKGFLFSARGPGLYEGSDEAVSVFELRWRS
jgi:hypothetical protein